MLDVGGIEFDDFEDDDEIGEGEELSDEQIEALLAEREQKRFEPIAYERKELKKEIAVVDSETDPFEPSFLVRPFTIGFRTKDRYVDFWGDDCVEQFFAYLDTLEEEYVIYAHNGGKFDFFFFLKHLNTDRSPMIMNGRLVKIYFGKQEFRDSFAIIPESLENAFRKTEIDYNKFKRNRRERHKEEIRQYQKDDCDDLYTIVTRFYERFGDTLTIASASLRMLRSFHGFEQITSEAVDARFRQYYFGGRNQCFETGILKPSPGKRWLVVDRNSMYPAVMRDELHPISATFELQERITDDTDFACIVARNHGALPFRLPNGGLDFTVRHGEFFATIHEIRAGLETGTLEIERVKHAWKFERKANFAEFVNHHYELRKHERDVLKDTIGEKNTKRTMNASYGKFALNPRKFKQWIMTTGEIPEPQQSPDHPDGWTLHSRTHDVFIWCRPTPRRRGFYNVATAASITGAARADLLRNIAASVRPIYCDTDSIICEEFHGDLDEIKLGGWKVEAIGDTAAIAGKKLYTVFDSASVDWQEKRKPLKKASKGVKLSPQEIVDVCDGREVMYRNPVPTFSLDRRNRTSVEMEGGGFATFISRNVRMTGKKGMNQWKRR